MKLWVFSRLAVAHQLRDGVELGGQLLLPLIQLALQLSYLLILIRTLVGLIGLQVQACKRVIIDTSLEVLTQGCMPYPTCMQFKISMCNFLGKKYLRVTRSRSAKFQEL